MARVKATGAAASVTGISVGGTGISTSVSAIKFAATGSYASIEHIDCTSKIVDLNEKMESNTTG